MREGTSGFWVTQTNGRISIGYEDYGVSEFGGGDFERTYYMDEENSKKLISELGKIHQGTLEEMLEKAFGRSFSDRKFWDFCKCHGITYSSSTWSG